MLTPSISQFHGRRAASKPARLGPLVMTAANGVTGGEDELTFTAVFNTAPGVPLASVDAADATKWTARFDGQAFEGNALTLVSATNSILVEMVVLGPESGPNEVNYAAAPSDIADVLGRKLAAFAGFPL